MKCIRQRCFQWYKIYSQKFYPAKFWTTVHIPNTVHQTETLDLDHLHTDWPPTWPGLPDVAGFSNKSDAGDFNVWQKLIMFLAIAFKWGFVLWNHFFHVLAENRRKSSKSSLSDLCQSRFGTMCFEFFLIWLCSVFIFFLSWKRIYISSQNKISWNQAQTYSRTPSRPSKEIVQPLMNLSHLPPLQKLKRFAEKLDLLFPKWNVKDLF